MAKEDKQNGFVTQTVNHKTNTGWDSKLCDILKAQGIQRIRLISGARFHNFLSLQCYWEQM